jgi:hypothetical protein
MQACVLPVARAQAAAGAVPPADDPAATETPSAALAAAAASPAKAAALKAAAAKVTAAKGLAAPGVAAEAADAGPPAPKDKGPPAAAAAAAAEEGDYAAPATDATAAWAAAAAGLSARWLANPWLVWGVGPMLGVNLGFFLTAALLELLLATRLLDSDLLVYPAGGDAPPRRRDAALAATQERIPFRKQLLTCLFIVAGPNVVANGVSLTLLMRLAGAALPAAWWPADALAAAWQLLAMAVVADFGLYWGHRVQHESKLLWQVHKVHHRIETPTPFSTMYIHGLDATLQVGGAAGPSAGPGFVMRALLARAPCLLEAKIDCLRPRTGPLSSACTDPQPSPEAAESHHAQP